MVYCHERSRLIGTLGVVMTRFWLWVVHVGNKKFATSVALCRTPSPQFQKKKKKTPSPSNMMFACAPYFKALYDIISSDFFHNSNKPG
jgi:hypothetical protein